MLLKFLEHSKDLRISKNDINDLLIDLVDDGFSFYKSNTYDDDYDDIIKIRIFKKSGNRLENFSYKDIQNKIEQLIDWLNYTFTNIKISFDCVLSTSTNGFNVILKDKQYQFDLDSVPDNILIDLSINVINLDSN